MSGRSDHGIIKGSPSVELIVSSMGDGQHVAERIGSVSGGLPREMTDIPCCLAGPALPTSSQSDFKFAHPSTLRSPLLPLSASTGNDCPSWTLRSSPGNKLCMGDKMPRRTAVSSRAAVMGERISSWSFVTITGRESFREKRERLRYVIEVDSPRGEVASAIGSQDGSGRGASRSAMHCRLSGNPPVRWCSPRSSSR